MGAQQNDKLQFETNPKQKGKERTMNRKNLLLLLAALLAMVLVFAGCVSDEAVPTTVP